jgi:hypothetical protein
MSDVILNDTKKWIKKTLTEEEKRHLVKMVTLKNETDFLKKVIILNDWYDDKITLNTTDIKNIRKWILNQTVYKKILTSLRSYVTIFGIKKTLEILGCPEDLLRKIIKTNIYFEEAFNYKYKETEKTIEMIKIVKIIKDIISGGLGDNQIKGIQDLILNMS